MHAIYCDAKDLPTESFQDDGIHLAGDGHVSLARVAQVALEGVISAEPPAQALRLESVDDVCSTYQIAAAQAMRRVP